MIWIDLIYNLTLLIALSVISGFVDTRWKRNTWRGTLLQGLVFGGAAAIGMLRPFVFAPGLIFDGRSVMISLGGLFFGFWTGLAACLITVPVRIIQGGPGAVMGVLVILVSAAIGVGFHQRRQRKPKEFTAESLFMFGLIVHLAMLAMTIALPPDMILPVLKRIGWPVILIYPLATILIGKILSDQAARTQFIQALRKSEENFRIIANYTVDWESWFGPDGKYIWVSPSVEKFTGYSTEEIMAMPNFISKLVAPADRLLVAATLQKALHGEKGENLEFQYVRKNGSVSWLSVAWQPVFDVSGNSLGVRVSGRDIAERKQMQKTIEQRIVALTRPLNQPENISFDDLFDVTEFQRIQDEFSNATGVTSALFRPDGSEITVVSNTSHFCRHVIRSTEKGCANCAKSDAFFGQSPNPNGPMVHRCLSAGLWDGCISLVVGDRHIANWMIGQVRDETQTEEQALQYAREIGADEAVFLKGYRKLPCMSGEKFAQIAQALFTLANQLSTSAYQNIQQARFIAERQKAEEDLLRLSAAINQTTEAVAVTDVHGIIQYVNPAFESITGYSSEEAQGKPIRFLKSGRHDESFYRNLWQTILSGQTWTGQIINKRKSGVLYTEETAISPVYDANGTTINYVAVKRDVTDELNKEEEYRHAQKMEAVGQLAGGIAHDFNNILQAILGFSEILLSKLPKETSEYRNVSEIKKAAARAADITRQLLIFSRKQPIEKKRIDINTVLQDTEVLLQILLGDRVHRILDLAEILHPVDADAGQITQIIMNLAINARDAMPDGGRLTISTENVSLSLTDTSVIPGSKPGKFVCLAVTDTGCGMSRGVKDHLFEPFFTTKEPGKGTGLGLAGIYGIIKKHKGWINVYSEEGMGTTFKVYLPASETDESSAEQIAEQNEARRERILLVEDDLAVRNMVIRLLQNAGYQVFETGSAEEALTLFDRERADFDLLFSDIILPEKTGIELADQIKKMNPAMPVLLYSGYRDQRERWSNLDSKGYHFLQKPFTVTTLLAAVYDTLAEAKPVKK